MSGLTIRAASTRRWSTPGQRGEAPADRSVLANRAVTAAFVAIQNNSEALLLAAAGGCGQPRSPSRRRSRATWPASTPCAPSPKDVLSLVDGGRSPTQRHARNCASLMLAASSRALSSASFRSL